MRNAMWVGGGITGMGEVPMLGVREKGIAKVIRNIFRNGEQGFFYDPSDLETQYQDVAGTAPVTGAGQPLGLLLDKSKGLVLGNELWDDSRVAFSGASSRLGDNRYNLKTTDNAYSGFSCATSQSIKDVFVVLEFTIESISGGQVGTELSGHTGTNTVGKHRLIGKSAVAGMTFKRISNVDAVVSDISVKRLLGNHAYQTASAARPILQQTPILASNLLPTYDFRTWSVTGAPSPISDNSFTTSGTGGVKADILKPNTSYILELDIENTSTVNIYHGASTNTAVLSGIRRKVLVKVTTDSGISFYLRNASAGTTTVYSVKVQEITGYRLDQSYLTFDNVDDKLITNLPSEFTNCTVLRAIPNVGTQVKYNQPLPMLYEDSANHAGLVAIDRALTRSEQLRLMTELDKRAGATSLETMTFKLFDNNQQGFVYDPNDLSTMFQNANGLEPVTAVGQPVGLILDKRKGSATGINLHTTATPISETSYTATGTRSGLDITVSKEEAGYGAVSLGIPTVKGKSYLLELIAPNNPGFWVLVSDSPASDSINRRVAISTAPLSKINTKIALCFTASSSVSHIHLNRGSLAAAAPPATFKDISVKEVLGNTATQPTSASRPILRKNAETGAHYLEFDGVDDHLLASLGGVISDFTTGHACDVLGGATKSIFSGETAGYLRTSNSFASVYSNTPNMYPRSKKDVLVQKVANGKHTLTTNLGGGDASSSIEPAGSVFWKPYSPTKPKVIGNFSPTHAALAVAMNYYGGFFIEKDMTSIEETTFRNLFNKRMGN